jgi:hypothetical protein
LYFLGQIPSFSWPEKPPLPCIPTLPHESFRFLLWPMKRREAGTELCVRATDLLSCSTEPPLHVVLLLAMWS